MNSDTYKIMTKSKYIPHIQSTLHAPRSGSIPIYLYLKFNLKVG